MARDGWAVADSRLVRHECFFLLSQKRNVVDRHYVMICGPGDDGQRGQAHWEFSSEGA